MEIKVLGPGCAKCNEVAKIMAEAIATTGVTASVEKVSDFQQIAKLGVFSTPAVVIDGQIKCVGKVPTKAEALAWLTAKR
jgi:small redox-active disulfide protein 2